MSAVQGSSWLNSPAWLPLVHALLHTLWQGAVAATGLFLALRLVPARRANLRYSLAMAALTLVLLAGVASWALLDTPPPPLPETIIGQRPLGIVADIRRLPPAVPTPDGRQKLVRATDATLVDAGKDSPAWVHRVAVFWLVGVGACLLRAAKGASGAERLRRCCQDLTDARILALAEELRVRLGVSRRVRFLVSAEIGVPSVMGVLWPAVLLPASMLTGVPPEQLRAIMAHELAHIRRGDYLVNLAQMLIEALLFFNPFVWWISRQIRVEREACCDQLAASECQSAASYVKALVTVIERSRPAAAPILAASGPNAHSGTALDRARRLLVPGYQPALRLRWFSLAMVLALSGAALSGLWLGTRAVAQTIKMTEQKPETETPDDQLGRLADAVLAAARAGDASKVASLLHSSAPKSHLSAGNITQMLDDLLQHRELTAFATLLEEAQQTLAGKDWKVSDPLLAGLVKDGRTDFLDVLLAHGLAPARLSQQGKFADQPIAEWVARRVAEETKRRAGIEALELAADEGDFAAMQRLVDAGTDVNGVGQDHNTPLIRAVFKDRLEGAQWLLEHGAQVDKPRFPGWNYTPLCLVNSVPMAELLKKNGANVQAKLFGRDVSILTYVVEFAKPEVVAWFLKQGLDPKMIGDNNKNLLFGLEDGHTANLLLDAGADPNQIDQFGNTPIVYARSAAVAQALIDHGARLTGFSTPLLPRMLNYGFVPAEALEVVLKAGADRDPATLYEALFRLERMGTDYPEEEKARRLLLAYGAKPIPDLPTPAPEINCAGTVSVADGTLIDYSSITVYEVNSSAPSVLSAQEIADDRLRSNHGYSSGSQGSDVDGTGTVRMQIPTDASSASFAVAAAGFATVFAGPFTPPFKEKADGTRFVLTRGFAAAIITVDEAGHPIQGAKLKAWYPGPPLVDFMAATTDASGSAVMEHIGAAPLTVQVSTDGYQTDEIPSVHLDPSQPFRCTLKKAQPVNGYVTATATGQPISGAKIKLGAVRGPFEETHADTSTAPLLTTTDAQGRFVLSSLRPDSHYYLFVDAPGYGGVLLREIKAGQTELKVALGPELFVRGTFRHIPPDAINGRDGAFTFGYDQFFDFAGSYYAVGHQGMVKPKNGEADFSIDALYDNSMEIIADGKETKLSAKELPKSGLVIDFAPASTASPAVVSPALPYKLTVMPEIKKAFPSGEGIEVQSVTGTKANFQVGGTYRIIGVCRQHTLTNATLYLGNTAEPGPDAIAASAGSSLYQPLPKGSTEFSFTFKLLRTGVLHLTVYDLDNHDKNDNAHGGIFLGKVDEVP